MSRVAFAAAVAGLFCLSTMDAQAAGRGYVQTRCGQVATTSAPVAEPGPPAAPAQGQTVQNMSVEPQAAPALRYAPMPVQTSGYYGASNDTFRYLNSYRSGNHRFSRVGDIQNRRLHPEDGFASMR